MKKRFLSMVLLLAMMITMIPPRYVWAADGTVPGAVTMSPVDGYSTNAVTLRGKITANGGSTIKRYGFAYGVAGGSTTEYKEYSGHLETGKVVEFELTGLNPDTAVWYCFYAINSIGEAKDESGAKYEVNGTQYASTLPEIEMDAPDIISPDSYDDIIAGEEVEFEWDEIDGATKYEWELYETEKAYGRCLTSGTARAEYVTLDGDWFKAGNVYSFYVRAVCDDSYSEWAACYYLVCLLPDEIKVDNAVFWFDSDGGSDYVNLTSSVAWTASVVGDWIDINKTSGSGDAKIRIDVEENIGEFRIGAINIETSLGSISIEIQQEEGAAPILEVNPTTINVSSEEEYYSIYVTSNIYGWRVKSDETWIDSLSNSSFNGDSYIRFSVDENDSTEQREGIITITGNGITRTVMVIQEGRQAKVGDINNDGEITNKDRFLLNRYLAGMAGYTDIDKTVADINGDGFINASDVEYLSRHLAGWVGYDKLPDFNTETNACAHTQYTDTYCDTVYVSSTIKTNITHTYYHVYNRKCSCGVDIGKVQGDLLTEDHSYVNNLCACGALNTTFYESWTGVNISGVRVDVYDMPNATTKYGHINKDEIVTVLGEYGDMYLIEYKLDGVITYASNSGNGTKQGYTNKSNITSQQLKNGKDLLEEIEHTFLDPNSKYETHDDLAKNEISINFFDLVFADVTDLVGVIDKLFDGEPDIVNAKHAIVTLMDSMEDDIYYEQVSESANVIIDIYEWIENTPADDIRSFFEGVAGEANVISTIMDIKSMKIDSVNNTLSQGMEYLFECSLSDDALMQKCAEILVIQNNNLNKKAAYMKVKNVAGPFGKTVGGIMRKLGIIATTADVMNSFYNVKMRDYSVELAKLNVLESVLENYRYKYLLEAVRELKSEMENTFDGIVSEAKALSVDIAIDYVFENAFGLWNIISGAIGIVFGQDAMAKRDACYLLEIEDATYWYIRSQMILYQDCGDVEKLANIKKALHAYTDCKLTLNELAIELNTWGIIVTSREEDQYGLTEYDYLIVWKHWYKQQHNTIDELFAKYGI